TKLVVEAGKPPVAVNVICVVPDQLKMPLVGVNAAWTRLVSIAWLNFRMICAFLETFVMACTGDWAMTIGSSGLTSDCAIKIFAVVPGTMMTGMFGVESTVTVSFVLS